MPEMCLVLYIISAYFVIHTILILLSTRKGTDVHRGLLIAQGPMVLSSETGIGSQKSYPLIHTYDFQV
jgi:hypothetical protein